MHFHFLVSARFAPTLLLSLAVAACGGGSGSGGGVLPVGFGAGTPDAAGIAPVIPPSASDSDANCKP